MIMGTLINLIMSLIMGAFFGHQTEEPQTAQIDRQDEPVEIYEKLMEQQQVLEC